jgi:hypothetical protein
MIEFPMGSMTRRSVMAADKMDIRRGKPAVWVGVVEPGFRAAVAENGFRPERIT